MAVGPVSSLFSFVPSIRSPLDQNSFDGITFPGEKLSISAVSMSLEASRVQLSSRTENEHLKSLLLSNTRVNIDMHSVEAKISPEDSLGSKVLSLGGSKAYADYMSIVQMFMGDEERLGKFLQAMGSIVKALEDFNSGGTSPEPVTGEPLQSTPPLRIGSMVSASFSMYIRAAFASIDEDSVEVSMVEINVEASIQMVSGEVQNQSDPLTLDLDGDGQFSVSSPSEGMRFDMNGDGEEEQTSFVTGGEGFLALDRNRNGIIDSGKELFGDQNGSASGFAELSRFDDNKDGRIDATDSIFGQLQVVTRNTLGALRTYSLHELGIQSINLGYADAGVSLGNGNTLARVGTYTRTGGEEFLVGDLLLSRKSI